MHPILLLLQLALGPPRRGTTLGAVRAVSREAIPPPVGVPFKVARKSRCMSSPCLEDSAQRPAVQPREGPVRASPRAERRDRPPPAARHDSSVAPHAPRIRNGELGQLAPLLILCEDVLIVLKANSLEALGP
jgi:hypothetical protein